MKKYYLLKPYIDLDRNMFMPSPNAYEETALPKDLFLKKDVHLYLKEADEINAPLVEAITTTSYTETDVSLQGGQKQKSTVTEFRFKQVKHQDPVVEEKEVKEEEVQPEAVKDTQLYINLMTAEELVELKGIGESTAKKIIKFREEKPFVSTKDLEKRIPLKHLDWSDYDFNFGGESK